MGASRYPANFSFLPVLFHVGSPITPFSSLLVTLATRSVAIFLLPYQRLNGGRKGNKGQLVGLIRFSICES